MLRYSPGGSGAGCHLVLDGELLGGLAERPAGLERGEVGGEDLRACRPNLVSRNSLVPSMPRS